LLILNELTSASSVHRMRWLRYVDVFSGTIFQEGIKNIKHKTQNVKVSYTPLL